MGRIVKQYEQAIKQHRAGKPIAVDELPTPPGYAPIPVPGAPTPPKVPTRPAPQPSAAQPMPQPSAAQPTPQPSSTQPSPPKVPPRQNSTRKMGNQVSNTHLEKQVALLLSRQKEFKDAALQAKRKGEIEQAKELLKTAKGFEQVIEAARCGLPVEMNSLPIPPSSRSILDER